MATKKIKSNKSKADKARIVQEHIIDQIPVKDLAVKYSCSEQSIRNWVKQYSDTTNNKDEKYGSMETSDLFTLQSNIPANEIAPPLIYGLEEAAKIAKITPEHLLHYAALGEIDCFIENPMDCYVADRKELTYFFNSYKRVFSNNIIKPQSLYFCSPLLLRIDTSDCTSLLQLGAIKKNKFSEKYDAAHGKVTCKQLQVKKDTNLYELNRLIRRGMKPNFFYVFHESQISQLEETSYESESMTINISKQTIKVLSKDLYSLIKKQIDITHQTHRDFSKELFYTHQNKSTLLIDLDQTAFDLYKHFNPIKVAHFNTKEKISQYLQDKFDFHKIHADSAALVILLSNDNFIIQSNKESPRYRTKFLNILIKAWHDLCEEKTYKKEDMDRYDDTSFNWLSKHLPKLGVHAKTSKSLSKVILSDNAPFHNPRKQKK